MCFAFLITAVLDYVVRFVAYIMSNSIFLRVEALLKLEMVYWKYRRLFVKLAWNLQNRF